MIICVLFQITVIGKFIYFIDNDEIRLLPLFNGNRLIFSNIYYKIDYE